MRRRVSVMGLLCLASCVAGGPSTLPRKYVVLFDETSAHLEDPSRAVILAAAVQAKNNQSSTIAIIRRVTPDGCGADVDALARSRARSVADVLIENGIASPRIQMLVRPASDQRCQGQERRSLEVNVAAA